MTADDRLAPEVKAIFDEQRRRREEAMSRTFPHCPRCDDGAGECVCPDECPDCEVHPCQCEFDQGVQAAMDTTNDLDEHRRKLSRVFPKSQMTTRSEVWCDLCKDPDRTCPHPVGTCTTCGEYITAAHDHIEIVPIESLRKRFLEVDPSWSWEPMAPTAAGAPGIVAHGPYDALWIKLTILGDTHIGVGQSLSNDRRFGPAGLKSLAIANAALEFGCGLQARAAQSDQRGQRELQALDIETVTNPNMPDLPEGGALTRESHEALMASVGMDLKDLRDWLKAHHPDVKVPVQGRMVGPNMMRVAEQTGATPLQIRAAIEADEPLPIEDDDTDDEPEDDEGDGG